MLPGCASAWNRPLPRIITPKASATRSMIMRAATCFFLRTRHFWGVSGDSYVTCQARSCERAIEVGR